MRRHRGLGLLVGSILVAGATAQQTGSLRGVVRDKDFDAPLRGAVVQVVELGLKVETNETGNFVFNQVKPGRYTVVAAKDGYVRQLRADVVVAAEKLTELSFELAGDFTDLEEFVVRDALQLGAGTEQALLDLRADSPALMDSISDDVMSKAGASDAAAALRLVAGASTADGKTAVVRGLPDRYVSSQLNGVLLPSADEDKRAVELDLFPAEIIDSLQVTKTFTPDQQGNASGGAVNVVLKGVPDEPGFFKWKVGTSNNSNVTGSEFLTYRDGGVHSFGKSGSERGVQPLGENWDGAVGVEPTSAPIAYKAAGAAGGSFDIGNGWRGGGFVNVFFDRDASFDGKIRDDSLWVLSVGEPMTPQFSQGDPSSEPFFTSLLDVTQASQSASFGGLGTFGIANKDHAINVVALFTQTAEDTATLAEDTRGKQYFFPGHDPEDPTSPGFQQPLAAPYLRLQTLSYVERSTQTLQLNGRHRVDVDGGPLRAAELNWTVAKSRAVRDEPDKRQFASAWTPASGNYIQYKPAAQFTLGNLQRIFEKVTEDSEEARVDLKFPFEAWGGKKGYLKFGGFYDHVDRRFSQETFSNFNDPIQFRPGQFDELDWSDFWVFEDHAITASEFDVDYEGDQKLLAGYGMLELPLTGWLRAIGGLRIESTDISIVNFPEAQTLWIPPGEFSTAPLLPGDADVAFSQQDLLPAVALVADPVDGVTLRVAYSETVARQTFKELTPVFQQEYLGGPIFVGNPNLEMSAIRNYDVRADWAPYEGALFSASYFRKDIKKPIEYVETLADYTFTTAVNYPRGSLDGIEVELRQAVGALWGPLGGMSVGGNSTWINSSVRLPQSEINEFIALQGVAPPPTRDMTNAPKYLWNLFATYDIAATGTGFGVFYTVTGDTLVQGPGPSDDFFVPSTYEKSYANLNASISQALGANVRLTLAAKNLTDEQREQVYRSDFIGADVTRRTYSEGVEYSLSIGGEVRF